MDVYEHAHTETHKLSAHTQKRNPPNVNKYIYPSTPTKRGSTCKYLCSPPCKHTQISYLLIHTERKVANVTVYACRVHARNISAQPNKKKVEDVNINAHT